MCRPILQSQSSGQPGSQRYLLQLYKCPICIKGQGIPSLTFPGLGIEASGQASIIAGIARKLIKPIGYIRCIHTIYGVYIDTTLG